MHTIRIQLQVKRERLVEALDGLARFFQLAVFTAHVAQVRRNGRIHDDTRMDALRTGIQPGEERERLLEVADGSARVAALCVGNAQIGVVHRNVRMLAVGIQPEKERERLLEVADGLARIDRI